MLENSGPIGMFRLPISWLWGFPGPVETFWHLYRQIHPKGVARYEKSVYNI